MRLVFRSSDPHVILPKAPALLTITSNEDGDSEMRLPRRVPWASIGELEQLCGWIYADENDYQGKTMAINRVSSNFSSFPLALIIIFSWLHGKP